MPFVYVSLQPSLDKPGTGRVMALNLPRASDGEWEGVEVKRSAVEGGGYGLYPRQGTSVDWKNLDHPVLMPYLGLETVAKDAHSLKLLLAVLRGDFERLTVGELSKAQGGARYVGDGLCAVPESLVPAAKRGPPLPRSTPLLQIAHPEASNSFRGGVQSVEGGRSSACYLLSEDVRQVLHLSGPRSHLFELLCAHGTHEHADRHLATHVATVHRREEGYVLINAHPAFADSIGLTGLINEPSAGSSACMKMIQGYARYLHNGDPLLTAAKLAQPPGALAAWKSSTLPPVGCPAAKLDADLSERMVLYVTTRKAYDCSAELTVDYGPSYARDYPSGAHKPRPKLYPIPADVIPAAALAKARWPQLPGWFNPHMQPTNRPAFAPPPRRGSNGFGPSAVARVLPDSRAVVLARLRALGYAEPEAFLRAAASSPTRQPAEPERAATPTTVGLKRPRDDELTSGAEEGELRAEKARGRGGAAKKGGVLSSLFRAARRAA